MADMNELILNNIILDKNMKIDRCITNRILIFLAKKF